MKIKKLLLVLLAVLLVFSLFGCGKKEPVEDVEPQDTAEQLDENIRMILAVLTSYRMKRLRSIMNMAILMPRER